VVKQKLELPSFTVAIPAYNEAENIEWLILKTLKQLPKYFTDYEIVIVNDGSTDETGQIADRLAKKHLQVRVVYQSNGGYSAAMLAGIKSARKEFVAYMPADGQFLVADMRHAFAHLQSSDLILGYRGKRPDYSPYRLLLSTGYLLFLWLLFGISYKDVGWVNIWRTKKVQRLILEGSRGIFLLTEILVWFKQAGYSVIEVPSRYRSRRSGKAKNTSLKVVLDTLIQAKRLWWRLHFSEGKA